MRIGHLDLSRHLAGAEEQLVVLAEALSAQGIEQHAIVGNPFLARRLSVCTGITVGPVVRSPLAATFLMPAVDLVHVHDRNGANAGILLNMARSMPYVLTQRNLPVTGGLARIHPRYARAESIICPSQDVANAARRMLPDKIVDVIGDARNPGDAIDPENGRVSAERIAAETLRVYRRIRDARGVPAVLL